MSEEPRWLDADEQRVWRSFLAAVSSLSEYLERRMQQDAGMPQSYYEVLVALSEAPAYTLRMSELASRSRFSRSRLSHAITKLEAHGWVQRTMCPEDGRGALATLSPSGLEVLRAAAPDHVEAVRRALFDVLSPEQVRQLGDISALVAARLAGPHGADDHGRAAGEALLHREATEG